MQMGNGKDVAEAWKVEGGPAIVNRRDTNGDRRENCDSNMILRLFEKDEELVLRSMRYTELPYNRASNRIRSRANLP